MNWSINNNNERQYFTRISSGIFILKKFTRVKYNPEKGEVWGSRATVYNGEVQLNKDASKFLLYQHWNIYIRKFYMHISLLSPFFVIWVSTLRSSRYILLSGYRHYAPPTGESNIPSRFPIDRMLRKLKNYIRRIASSGVTRLTPKCPWIPNS